MSDDATFSKFVRFFTNRLVQTLVQARLGNRIEHECTGSPGQTDWFNTKVDELGEIAAYLRTAVDEYPPQCNSVTVEFLLYTTDGLHLPLESWVISVDEESDQEVNVNGEFYHKLGTALRSAAGAARVTPMYRYFVKKQSPDTFVVLYRIYTGTMDADLGKDAKHISIAVLPSPFGTLNVDLSYRTDMTLPTDTPRKISEDNVVKQTLEQKLPCRPSFSDCIRVSGGDVEPSEAVPIPQFEASPAQASSPARLKFRIGRSTSSEESMQLSSSLDTKDCAFQPQKPIKVRSDSFPFEQLLSISPRKRTSICSEEPATGPVLSEVEEDSSEGGDDAPSCSNNIEKRDSTTGDGEEVEDDSDTSYVKVYAGMSDNTANLSQFIKDCRTAPQSLDGFAKDDANSLVDQLQQFSAQEKEFSEFIRTVRRSVEDD